jgi:hypothetical protein
MENRIIKAEIRTEKISSVALNDEPGPRTILKLTAEDNSTEELGKHPWYYWRMPTAYQIRKNDDIIRVFFRRNRMDIPLEFLDKWNVFIEKYQKETETIISELPYTKETSVQDILTKANINYYSISYRDTRTLERAHCRPILVAAISYLSGILIFPKRGGYLAYRWSKATYGITFSNIELQDALKDLLFIKENKMGKVYNKKGLDILRNEVILNKL